MSDIKNIDNIKTFWKRSSGEIITFTEGTLMDIIQLGRKDIISLITVVEFLQKEKDEQHDTFYNEVRFADQKLEHSNLHNANYVAELCEEIVFIKKTADVIDEKNQELFKQIAENEKEIKWLRGENERLESSLQHYRGYE